MLATRVKEPFARQGMGLRAEVRRVADRRDPAEGAASTLATRKGFDLAEEQPEIVRAVEELPGGDLVGGRRARRPRRARRLELPAPPGAERAGSEEAPCLVLFDCLEENGVSPRVAPALASARRARGARRDVTRAPPLALAERLGADGVAAFERAVKKGWEGVVGKDLSSPLRARPAVAALAEGQGAARVRVRRSAGFTLPSGPRPHFGALLVGSLRRGSLRYCGSVGTGFSDAGAPPAPREAPAAPAGRLPVPARPARGEGRVWVAPKLVAQVAYAEWTGDAEAPPALVPRPEEGQEAEGVRLGGEGKIPRRVTALRGRS